jgi:hypothetical protein
MENEFCGTWVDNNNDTISVTEAAGLINLKYSNGRGPFSGYEVDLYSPVISVNFADDQPFTGVLTNNNTISWSNGTSWKRQS